MFIGMNHGVRSMRLLVGYCLISGSLVVKWSLMMDNAQFVMLVGVVVAAVLYIPTPHGQIRLLFRQIPSRVVAHPWPFRTVAPGQFQVGSFTSQQQLTVKSDIHNRSSLSPCIHGICQQSYVPPNPLFYHETAHLDDFVAPASDVQWN